MMFLVDILNFLWSQFFNIYITIP